MYTLYTGFEYPRESVELMPPIIIFIVVLSETPWKCAANGAFVHPRIDLWVNVEQRWNDTDRGKIDSEKNLSQCRFFPQQIPLDWCGREPGLRCKAGD
jgi:hypothetical protein